MKKKETEGKGRKEGKGEFVSFPPTPLSLSSLFFQMIFAKTKEVGLGFSWRGSSSSQVSTPSSGRLVVALVSYPGRNRKKEEEVEK